MEKRVASMRFVPISLLVASLIVLVYCKLDALNLPHFWDEAFPYSYAIGHMTENGSGILSDSAPKLYTTGHPLLYYFFQANWNKLVGGILWLERLFPMIISSLILLFTYLIGKKMKHELVGGIAALILSTQSTFLAQASFQLPETLLTLFLLMSIYFHLTDRKWAFVLGATGMVFTKETGVILLFILFLNFTLPKLKQLQWKKLIKSSWIYVIPIALNFLFYLHQYFVQGWFLFPRHTGFMSSKFDFIWDQFSRYFAHLFIYEGRNITFFLTISFVITIVIFKRKNEHKINLNSHLMLLSSLIITFLFFSAFNFYSERYILCLFPLFTLLASYIVYQLLKEKQWASICIGVVLSVITLTKAHTKLTPTDHSLGYVDAVITQRDAINYCDKMNWQNESIQTSFLMAKNLTSHYPRYLSVDQLFTSVNDMSSQPAIVILSSNEPEEQLIELISNHSPIERFESNGEWCEVYLLEKLNQ